MHESNGMPTPMSSSLSLKVDPKTSAIEITEYQRIIGKLQYLSFTRPDIAFAVNKLAQFMHHPQHSQWVAVKRLLRYLKLTCMFGLNISCKADTQLRVYSDSDWAGNIVDWTSTTGFVLYYGASPISWSSKKQRTVARSSTEAEYRAVASAVAETNWISNLLHELNRPLHTAPHVFCDNVGTTYICKNPVFHSRMKHIALDFHFVREQVQRQSIQVHHIPSSDQVADLLTKPLPKTAFLHQFCKLGLVHSLPRLRGDNKTTTLC